MCVVTESVEFWDRFHQRCNEWPPLAVCVRPKQRDRYGGAIGRPQRTGEGLLQSVNERLGGHGDQALPPADARSSSGLLRGSAVVDVIPAIAVECSAAGKI